MFASQKKTLIKRMPIIVIFMLSVSSRSQKKQLQVSSCVSTKLGALNIIVCIMHKH